MADDTVDFLEVGSSSQPCHRADTSTFFTPDILAAGAVGTCVVAHAGAGEGADTTLAATPASSKAATRTTLESRSPQEQSRQFHRRPKVESLQSSWGAKLRILRVIPRNVRRAWKAAHEFEFELSFRWASVEGHGLVNGDELVIVYSRGLKTGRTPPARWAGGQV